jgi:uncharacterized protein (TIGR03382 family)
VGTCPQGMQCGALQTGIGCLPGCKKDLDCAVGTACQGGECLDPTQQSDSGCPLCQTQNDGGGPIVFKDAGQGSGSGSGGCGCSGGGEAVGLLALAFSALRMRKRR